MRRSVLGLGCLAALVPCASLAGPLEEDLEHLGRVSARREVPALTDRILEALRRRHPAQGAAFAQLESRLLMDRARREPNPDLRKEILAKARVRLQEALKGGDEVSSLRPALDLARLAREEAEADKGEKAFEAALASFEDLRKRLEKADDQLASRLEAGKIAEKEHGRLSHEVFLVSAEAYYEWGQALLSFARTVPMDPARKREILLGEESGAAARFDLAALMTESESDSKRTIYYPAPYLGKAESERAAGDREAARATLRDLLSRPVDHPAGPHYRQAAMGMLSEVSLGAKEWGRAREEAEALRKSGGGGGEIADLLLARISAEEGLAQREADPQGTAWRKRLDEAIAALETLAGRKGRHADEAREWAGRYRSRTGEGPVRETGFLSEARDLAAKGDAAGALSRYRWHLASFPPDARPPHEPAVWLSMAESLHKLDRHLETAALLAEVVEHPGASEAQAAQAASFVQAFWLKWLERLFAREEAVARSSRLALSLKRRMTERFPSSAASVPFFYDLGEAARLSRDWEGALAHYARVPASDASPDAAGLHLKALAKSVSCRHALLLRQLRGRIQFADAELSPLSESLRRFEAWLDGAGAKAEPGLRAFALEIAVADSAFLSSLGLPAESLRRFDRYGKSLPAGAPEPGWLSRFRAVALAQLGRAKEAREAWGAAAAKGAGDEERKALRFIAESVLVPISLARSGEARKAGNAEGMREWGNWVSALLTYSLEIKGKPTGAELAKLLHSFRWQIQQGEHAAAAGIGEFVLEKAAEWDLPADSPDKEAATRLRFLDGLSYAYMGQEDWARAAEANRRIEEIYAAEGKVAAWAQERIAECDWRLATEEKDPSRRKETLTRCYGTYSKLWEDAEEGSEKRWDYALQMCRVRLAGGEHGLLMGFLARLGAESAFGDAARRDLFAEAAARAAREGSAEVRATAAAFLERMWEAGIEAGDPVPARLAR